MRRLAIPVLMLFFVMGCGDTPTGTSAVGGTFPLVRWNDLTVPVDLGATPPSTCRRTLTEGALTLNNQVGSFRYSLRIVNCNGLEEGSSRFDGSYVQSGDSLDFRILPRDGGSSYTHFSGRIMSDRIAVTDGSRMEFMR